MSEKQRTLAVGYTASTPGRSAGLFSFSLSIPSNMLGRGNIMASGADDLPEDLPANLQTLIRRLFEEELIFFFGTNLRQPVLNADFYTNLKTEREVMEFAEKLCAIASELTGDTKLPKHVKSVRDVHNAIKSAFKVVLL